jgi:hypothetical protein
MKITFSVEMGKDYRHNSEREIECSDFQGMLADLNKAIEFHELKHAKAKRDAANREAERRLAILAKPSSSKPEPKRDDGPHGRVFEYDGAMKCLDCHAEWGALPGHPLMPVVCQSAAEVSHE